jgi:hypothetical protein
VSPRLRRVVPFTAAVWRATDPMTGLMTAPISGAAGSAIAA